MTTYRLIFACDYELPTDLAEREELYGAVDPTACIQVDMDNDPAACLMDAGLELVSVTEQS